jgi:hypothetical protein
MMMSRNNPLTPEIIIETLKRSSLQTVLIEGKDDLQVYRNIEEDLHFLDIDFLPCNGRSNLLEVYKSKNSISSKLLFICDSDLWLFVPRPNYIADDIIVTNGYSIENELYQDGIEILNTLFSEEEIVKKKEIIESLCLWFAYEVSLVLNSEQYDCKFSEVSILNHTIMELNSTSLSTNFLKSRNFREPSPQLLEDIKTNYKIKLRGKFIFQTLEKIFQERNKKMVKYRRDQLFDLIYRTIVKSNDDNKILNIRRREIMQHFRTAEYNCSEHSF